MHLRDTSKFLVGVWAVALVLAPDRPAQDVAKLDGVIAKAREEWSVPGLSVAIVKDGKVLLSKGYGVRELGKPEGVDGDTLFAIASNTKAFTAAAVAMLAEENKLRFDDPVQRHLPWMQLYDSWVSAELRVDDLLCHRSGLGTFSGDLLWWGTPYSPEEILRRTRHLKPAGPFRASYGYSNLMFLAAGEVIVKASGVSWQQFMKSRIFDPVGMSRTLTSVTELAATTNIATPHKPTPDKITAIPWYNWDSMAAAGGIISSSGDMAKWLIVQLERGRIDGERRLFSEASSRRMWHPHTPMSVGEAFRKRSPTTHFRAYGLGWVLADYKSRLTASHGGGYDGMYSHVLIVPEEKLGIVVLTNSMTGIAPSLANTIVDEFLGGDQQDWLTPDLARDRADRREFYERIRKQMEPKAAGTKPSRSSDAYVGRFRCPMYGDATVGMEDNRLVLRLLPNASLVADLEHLHYDTFVIRWRAESAWFAEGTVQFVPNRDGDFVQLKLDVPNDDLWFHELELKRVAQ